MNMRPKLVILGAGWGGFRVLRSVDRLRYDVSLIAPRNYFVFTPLLPSSVVGTVEFRSITEPIRRIGSVNFVEAYCENIDPISQTVTCRHSRDEIDPITGVDLSRSFSMRYDKLVISVGCRNLTFNVKGVEDHALFLSDIDHARKLRYRILDCFERSCDPTLSEQEKRNLLHFVIVGGGPTGVETAAEIADCIEQDLRTLYPDTWHLAVVSLFEAKTLLSTFDQEIQEYTMKLFRRRKIDFRIGAIVQQVTKDSVILADGRVEKCGLVLWSTGVGPRRTIQRMATLPKDRKGFITTNEFLQVASTASTANTEELGVEVQNAYSRGHVFALGDCSTVMDDKLPATAQVAHQQGIYLGKYLNNLLDTQSPQSRYRPFVFQNIGMLSYVGSFRAVASIPAVGWNGKGIFAWLFWRSAYLTRLVSVKNKILVPIDWLKSFIFGRDISKF